MKYKKPLIALTFALLLVCALICFLYAFKTADVEVTVTKTEVSDSSVEEGVLNSLNSLKGKCLPFLSEEKIVEAAKKGSPYAEVISVKKSYPNKIVVNVKDGAPCGLFTGYYGDEEKTKEVWHDGYYHTGDTAWRDEDGFYWYVGRVDDVIKSSGYRIGPFEIESVIMELPYVLECGVSAAPDEFRGQVVKASIVLTKGTEPTEELKKEIQNYVKANTAP